MSKLEQKLRVKTKLTFVAAAFVSGFLVYFFLTFFSTVPKELKASTETISTGSFIVNMGVVPQTRNNSLKPYGMIYDLIVNYSVPVKWIIEPSKSKDGTDFTYASTDYKGGPFIIPGENINAAVKDRITYWIGQGISGVYITSPVNVPVYSTLTNFPRTIIDDASNNSDIIIDYFTNAMIPSSAYTVGMAASLTTCSDLWVNPHGDPTWATHGYLYNLTTVSKSNIWCQCHCVSVMEGVRNSSAPFEQLNYLSTNGLKCYSNGKCGASTETHAGGSTAPYTHNYPADPVMQFMGTMSGASNSGSERWYQPQSTGGWRPNSKLLVTTSDGTGDKQGVLMTYGPAYGDPNNGYVMYTGGHNLDNAGTAAERVAAQRSFFNFILFTAWTKHIKITDFDSPSTIYSEQTVNVSTSVTSGTPPYTYQWSSTIGGTFSNPNNASTSFTAPYTIGSLQGNIVCTITDACGRRNFASNPFTIPTNTLPISLKSFSGIYYDKRVTLSWITASEVNNDYFEILRSTDGINFITIGSLRGSGNSTVELSYNLVDKDVPSNYQVLYYKLRQFDMDGRQETFDAIAVELDEDRIGVYEVMPNPFTSSVHIDYYATFPQKVSITLISNSGKIILSRSVDCPRGHTPIDIDNLEGIPPGIYFLILSDDKKQKLTRIIKS